MDWLVNNWYIVVILLVLAVVVAITLMAWLNKPTVEQIKNIKEWLLYAVCEAEKQLGSGTGQLKLRYVYDLAVERFKFVSLIPFSMFEKWVDEALDEMKKILSVNKKIKMIVEKK